MSAQSAGSRLTAILLSGLALGALGLTEPLVRFWNQFHLLGLHWLYLILIYLGFGLVCACVAGIFVTIGLATRAIERRPVFFASYYVASSFALAAVLITAPLIRHELINTFMFEVHYAVIFPILLFLGAILTVKLTPHLIRPILAALISYPSGRISRGRLIGLMLIIGAMIPFVGIIDYRATYRMAGRPARAEFRSRPGPQPIQNLVLITIDALRADHLGTYGYPRPTSPGIDSLAAHGALFENCFAQGPRTGMSLGALFTSLYPTMHSLRSFKNTSSSLPPERETLAESMRDAGLLTMGLMASPVLKREWGLTQGFDRIEEFHHGYLELFPVKYLMKLGLYQPENWAAYGANPVAEAVVDRGIEFLTTAGEQPFYLHVDFMDLHHPFTPPRTFEVSFRSPDASPIEAPEFWQRSWSLFKMLPSEETVLSPADLQRLVDLYDATLRYVDAEVTRLLKHLTELGLARNTLIVLTGSRGIEFMDHGNVLDRAEALHDESIHVPLIIVFPEESEPHRYPEIVRHIDLLPWLQEIFDLPVRRSVQGRSLTPLLSGVGEWIPLPAYSESNECLGVRTRTHKATLKLSDGTQACYDLVADPREMHPVTTASAKCDSLQTALNEFLQHLNLPPQ